MYCKNCGKESIIGKKFCTNCGTAFSIDNVHSESTEQPKSTVSNAEKKINKDSIIKAVVILLIVGGIVYSNINSSSIDKNNTALLSFDSGDSNTAISQFKEASQDAVGNDTKMNILKNLAYVYFSESKDDLSLNTFKEALSLAQEGSFDYYLISGEIALAENKPNSALLSYNKAYQLNPESYQINNSLNLFYIDIEGAYPELSDYPKALTYALKAYSLDKSETAKENLAIAYFFNQNFDQTISLMLTLDLPKKPYAYLWIGWSYAGKGDVSNAKLYFKNILGLL